MSYFEQAVEYIQANKSFRAFENECDVPADKSHEYWSMAALHLQESSIRNYTVSWSIELDAPTPELAAQMAYSMLQDPDSTATCFEVAIYDGEPEQDVVMVDVSHTEKTA